MLNPISHIDAVKILQEIDTKGSSPLEVMDGLADVHIAKTTTSKTPRVELINELICSYFTKCWGLKSPEPVLVKIGNSVVETYENEFGKLSKRYENVNFDNETFYGTRRIHGAVELDKHIDSFTNKGEWNKFENQLDIVKIGVFDIWLGNKDRWDKNPNILFSPNENGFVFHPIDHTASFAYATDYKKVNDATIRLEEEMRILKAPLIRSIVKYADKAELQELHKEIFDCITLCNQNIGFIFDQVPKEWGFSKKARNHLIEFLSDEKRNKIVSTAYNSYI